MSDTIQNIIKFYRDCYLAEYSGEKVSNFYSSSVSNLFYPPTFQCLSQKNYLLPVDSTWGNQVYKDLAIESSEKKLVCGTFFLKDKSIILGKAHQVFTPLFIHDVILTFQNGVYFIEIDHSSLSLNPVAVNCLNALDENHFHHYDELSSELLSFEKLFSFEGLVFLQTFFKENYPSLDIDLLENRIESDDRIADLKSLATSRSKKYFNVLFPDLLIGLTEKPKKSKDVINELTTLSEKEYLQANTLLSVFFKDVSDDGLRMRIPSNNEIVVPISLSDSQKNIIKSSRQAVATVVVGPPGTGKSYSIAALAIQAFEDGKKVLIASKSEQACQVIFNKIQNEINVKDITINASKARYKMTVATKLKNLANGIGVKEIGQNYLRQKKNEIKLLKNQAYAIVVEIQHRASLEKKWGKRLANPKKGFFHNLKKKWVEYQYLYKNSKPIWKLKSDLDKLDQTIKRKERNLLKLTFKHRQYNILNKNRADIIHFGKAFKEDRGNVIKEIFSAVDFDVVLEALPIWVCRSIDVANIVPLQEELFDLLIIDEASQCDIASSIPLVYRAKSIVIVGDPNQLRHISFVSNRKEVQFRSKYNLSSSVYSYRDKSILDLVNESIQSQKNILFLDEHFRSRPDLIAFSNQNFYAGQLKVMTDHLNDKRYNNLIINFVENGERNVKGENLQEAEKIVDSIIEIISKEVDLHHSNSSTIGVISPFRGQVQLIKRMLRRSCDVKTILKHKILIGTPFKFQGEEKDVIFLSFTIDDNTHPAAVKYLERPDVFNVSITRAKNKQEVFISVNPKKLRESTLLSRYLANNEQKISNASETKEYDAFLKAVKRYIQKLNAGVILIDRKICGVNIDIVIIQKDRTIGIDLIGYPGEFTRQLSMNELAGLERAKMKVFLLPYSAWYFDKTYTKKALNDFLETPSS